MLAVTKLRIQLYASGIALLGTGLLASSQGSPYTPPFPPHLAHICARAQLRLSEAAL